MPSVLKDALDYLAGQVANLTREDDTAGGQTDDKQEGKPTQAEQIGAGTTDGRNIANAVFGKGKVLIPAEIIAAADTYDVTEAATRINKLYGLTRDKFYEQASAAVQTRKNRLSMKQELVSECFRQSEKPKKVLEALAEKFKAGS